MMSNNKLQKKIKNTKDFIDLWSKYHSLYKNALSKPAVSDADEEAFQHTKQALRRRYEQLRDSSKNELKGISGTDVFDKLLSIDSIKALSDKALEALPAQWALSHAVLNNLLEGLEGQKQDQQCACPFLYLIKKITGKI